MYKRQASSTSRSGYRTFKEEQQAHVAKLSATSRAKQDEIKLAKMRSRSRTLEQSSSKEGAQVSSATRMNNNSSKQ